MGGWLSVVSEEAFDGFAVGFGDGFGMTVEDLALAGSVGFDGAGFGGVGQRLDRSGCCRRHCRPPTGVGGIGRIAGARARRRGGPSGNRRRGIRQCRMPAGPWPWPPGWSPFPWPGFWPSRPSSSCCRLRSRPGAGRRIAGPGLVRPGGRARVRTSGVRAARGRVRRW